MPTPRRRVVDRAMFDGVLSVMRQLGGCTGLDEALKVIADAVVDVLGFGAAAINVTTSEGDQRVEAVVGPAGIHDLLGKRTPTEFWLEFLDAAEPWGELRYFSHDRDQTLANLYPSWSPQEQPPASEPDAWQPDDQLCAPLWDEHRQLVGVLSVDLPVTGLRPDREQCGVLELFASHAAKAIRDTQAQERADLARHEVETLWRTAFEQTPTSVAMLDPAGNVVAANGAAAAFLGLEREELVTKGYADLVHPDDRDNDAVLLRELVQGCRASYGIEKRFVRRDQTVVFGLMHVAVLRDEQERVHTIVVQVTDLTERKIAEHRLARQLAYDELTGLRNRTSLQELLTRQLGDRESVAVLFCDVDRFKTINDSLGRPIGDEVLVAVASRLHDALPDCAIGRVGDDEFVVLHTLPADGTLADARQLGDRLLTALQVPVGVAGVRLTVSACIGVAVSTVGHEHADELLADAEQAMRRAKQHGGNRLECYDPERDRSGTRQDLELEQALRLAIGTGAGLSLYLQPIVRVVDEATVGGEALLRWNHPQHGVLAPAQFLPIAERSGLMTELGDRILTLGAQAAARIERWVAVNVSGSQLGRGSLPASVRTALRDSSTPAARMQLEITETALVDASAVAIDELHEIAEMGVAIALDDFGTGYSSLSLLRDLPISAVKIDKSFTGPIAESRRTAALVRSLVSMCDALGITTVAEGIETSEQLALVRALGCDHAQGYLFGRPQPCIG